MAKTKEKNPAEYIVPLNMNGLQGRMLRMPPPKNHKREILVVYGHHALLERWWGLIQNFNTYGAVTMPDLPGFGGMDSFYKIGVKPDVDAFADYLASFIKLRYKRRRISIVGISFGFVIVTRMLQRYPDLAKRVDILVSAVGFSHADEFLFSRTRMAMYRLAARTVSLSVIAPLFRVAALNPWTLRLVYSKTHNAKHKFIEASGKPEIFEAIMSMETKLWQTNDIRTHMFTSWEFLRLDNCQRQVDIPVWHAFSSSDHYFDNAIIEQHFRIIFSDYHGIKIMMKAHAPSVLAGKKESAVLIPLKLRQILAKSS